MPEESDKLESNQIASGIPAHIKRRSILAGSREALRYLSVFPWKRFRYSDRLTDVLAAISILSLLFLIFMPINSFQVPLTCICDGLFLLTIVVFTMNRLGILTALPERQFLLVWDIILGAFLLGVLFSANCTLVLSHIKHLANFL
jgi:hypothetical protein